MNLSSITLNYKQITINTSLIQNFCLIDHPFSQNIIVNHHDIYQKLFKSSDLIFYQYFYKTRIKDRKKLEKIIITKEGLHYNVINSINQILSIYNINLSQKNIKEELTKLITNLKNLKNLNELQNKYPLLYKKHKEVEKEYLQIYKNIDLTAKTKVYKSCLRLELIILEYIKNNLENNFKEISNCNDILEVVDLKKLNLVVASKLMEKSKKTNDHNTIIYLKEYLKNNQDLVENNYEVKNYISNEFGLETMEKYSIKEIYNYVYPLPINNQSQELSSYSMEQYNYTFLEPSHTDPKEILSKYYLLGIKSNNPEKLKELLRKKINYYQTLNITSIKIGLNSFDGYLGLCLEDETVILDKFYDDIEKGKIAKKQAIYITDEENFEQVTRLTKQECMSEIKKGKIKARRVYHTNTWENRII